MSGDAVPGCEGDLSDSWGYCIQDSLGRSNANGATVEAVVVTSSDVKNTAAGAEKEDSGAGSASMLFSAGVASAVVFGLF